jgi:hypothetical protein
VQVDAVRVHDLQPFGVQVQQLPPDPLQPGVSWVNTKSQKSWSGSAGSAVAAQSRSAQYTSGTENASSVAIRGYGHG